MSEPDPWDDDAPTAAAEGAEPEAQAPQLYYGSVDEFVRDYLIHTYRRRINGTHRVWAAEWWRYEEAIGRLEALWRAWEHLRLDPTTGASVWWRDHADPHMTALMSPDGPFAGEGIKNPENTNKPGQPLPYSAPPVGMFPDVRGPDGSA